MSVDVCIIGAGIAGLSAAYHLTREGKSVVVLDDGPVGGGETGRTTAHLAYYLDDGLAPLENLHGTENLKLAVQSHRAAVDRIESIVRDEGIDCEFDRVDGYLFLGAHTPAHYLKEELAAACRADLCDAHFAEQALFPGMRNGGCLRFPRQGQFHPLKYLIGMAEIIRRRGGRICTGVHAESVQGGAEAQVKTSDGLIVRAAAVVVATNTPINDRVAIHTKQEPNRTYVIGAQVPKGSVLKALYWDTEDPYHYVRIAERDSHDVLIVGGEDHKTGQGGENEARWGRLEQWARRRWPVMGRVEYRWSGQVMEPVDGLAYIGRNPMDHGNVYIATGDSGMGMTHGTIAGMLLTDLILGRENPWAKLYDPGRATLRSAREYAKLNLNVVMQYRDWVTGGEVSDISEIRAGSGAVLRRGLKKVAAYRDSNGKIHECSAVCPHMGCIVTWNSAERTWDCPCHGSRFDPLGHVVNGPANEDLRKIESREEKNVTPEP